MPWSEEFVEELAKPQKSPIWYMQTLRKEDSPGWDSGRHWSASSHQASEGDALIDPRSVKIEGSRLQPRTWNISVGGFSLEIISANSFYDVEVRRGHWAVLYMGFGGWSFFDYQKVALGVVSGVTRLSGVRYQIKVAGPMASWRSRLDGRLERVEFVSAMPRTTTTATFTTGGLPGVQLKVDDADEFLPAEPHDMALTIGDDGTIFTYSAKTGNEFTIEESGVFGSPAAAASYASGLEVKQVALYDGHPITLLKRFLVSTGEGLFGSGDVYLEQMGLGMPINYIDEEDMAVWEGKRQPGAGSWRMQIAVTERQTNGLQWFLGLMQLQGFWPVLRQGQWSARAAVDPFDGPDNFDGKYHIYDRDIWRVDRVELYSPDNPVEYGELIVRWDPAVGAVITQDKNIHTWPGARRWEIDIGPVVFQNEDQVALEVALRHAVWGNVVPLVATIVVYGWHWARLVEGDWTLLTSSLIRPFGDRGTEYRDKKCLVVAVDPFVGPYTILTLAIPQEY